MKEEVRRRYRISGRVQGVGFRWWAFRMASRHGVRGRVLNLADGSVEVEVAGDPVDVDRFTEILHTGPSGARVSELRELEPGVEPLPEGFEIVQ